MYNEQKQELPMNWYKFFNYVILPASVVSNYLSIFEAYNEGKLTLIGLILTVAVMIYDIFLIIVMHKRAKDGYYYILTHFLILIALQLIENTQTATDLVEYFAHMFGTILGFCISFIPQYIYFKKRKCVFENEINEKDNEIQNNKYETIEQITIAFSLLPLTSDKIYYFYNILLNISDISNKILILISTAEPWTDKYYLKCQIEVNRMEIYLNAINKLYIALCNISLEDKDIHIFYNKKEQTYTVLKDFKELLELYNKGLKEMGIFLQTNGTSISNRTEINQLSEEIRKQVDLLADDLVALGRIEYI